MHPLHLLAIGYIAGLLTGGLSLGFERGDAVSTLTAALVLAFSVVLAMSRRIRGKRKLASRRFSSSRGSSPLSPCPRSIAI